MMNQPVDIVHLAHSSTVTFNHPPMNLMDVETIDALIEAHREADAHPDTRVIVTRSGIDGLFSNGLDPMNLLALDHDGRINVFEAVGRLIRGIYSLTKPHITVVNGPAMAGGAVLAILSDFRYFDKDNGRICFAEVKVGLPIPEGLLNIVRAVCNPASLREVVMLGKNLDAQQALDAGLADAIAPTSELDAIVEKQVVRLSRLSLDVLRETKAAMRAHVMPSLDNLLDGRADGFAKFVDGPYLEEGLKAVLEARPPVFVK